MVLPCLSCLLTDQGDIHYTMTPPNALQQMRVLWKVDSESQILLNTLRTGGGGGHLNCLNARYRGF